MPTNELNGQHPYMWISSNENIAAKLDSSTSWLFQAEMGATANRDKQMSGFGAVIREAGGNVIAATIRSSKFYEDMAYMEGEAMELGLQVAGNAKPSSFIFETDSQEVADFVNNGQSSMKEIFWVVSEIQNLMKYQNSSIYLDIVMQLLILLLS